MELKRKHSGLEKASPQSINHGKGLDFPVCKALIRNRQTFSWMLFICFFSIASLVEIRSFVTTFSSGHNSVPTAFHLPAELSHRRKLGVNIGESMGNHTRVSRTVKKKTLVIAVLGDLLISSQINLHLYQKAFLEENGELKGAWNSSKVSFKHMWQQIQHLWSNNADITIANLEGSVSNVNQKGELVNESDIHGSNYRTVYSSSGTGGGCNYPMEFLNQLKHSKIDMLSTANNRITERGLNGLSKTIENIRANGMIAIGTRDPLSNGPLKRYTVSSKHGWNIAWIACTESYKSIRSAFRDHMVFCSDVLDILSEIKTKQNIDAVIVVPHWGKTFGENKPRLSILGNSWIEAGANLVLGYHQQNLQPIEPIVENNVTKGLISYSLGSVFSGLKATKAKASAVLFVTLEQAEPRNVNTTFIKKIKYTPICEVNVPSSKQIKTVVARTAVCNEELLYIHNALKENAQRFSPRIKKVVS